MNRGANKQAGRKGLVVALFLVTTGLIGVVAIRSASRLPLTMTGSVTQSEDRSVIISFVTEPVPSWVGVVTMTEQITTSDFVTASTWNHVLETGEGRDVRGLLIDDTTYAEVDWDWTAQRMRRGMVLGGIHLAASDVVTHVLSPSLEWYYGWWSDAFSSTLAAMPGDRFTVVASWVGATPPVATAAALEVYHFPVAAGIASREAIFEDVVGSDVVGSDDEFFFSGVEKFNRIFILEARAAEDVAGYFEY